MRALSGVEIATDEVQLVDSDHRVSGRRIESNFIQLIDLIIGATRVCLEDTTTRRYPRQLALEWLPLLQALTHPEPARRWDYDGSSPYGQFRRCNMSFFPSVALTAEDLASESERARSSFYRTRRPALVDPAAGVQEAFEF